MLPERQKQRDLNRVDAPDRNWPGHSRKNLLVMNTKDKKYLVGAFSLSSQRHYYFNDAMPFPHFTENPSEGRQMTFDEIVNYRRPSGDSVGEYMSNYGKLHVIDATN